MVGRSQVTMKIDQFNVTFHQELICNSNLNLGALDDGHAYITVTHEQTPVEDFEVVIIYEPVLNAGLSAGEAEDGTPVWKWFAGMGLVKKKDHRFISAQYYDYSKRSRITIQYDRSDTSFIEMNEILSFMREEGDEHIFRNCFLKWVYDYYYETHL